LLHLFGFLSSHSAHDARSQEPTASTASSKAVLHTIRFSVSFRNLHYLSVALRSSRSCLGVLPRHPSPLIFLYITCLRRQILRKMSLVQSALLSYIVCRMVLSSLILFNTPSFLLRSFHLISSLLQYHISNIKVISELLSKVSKLQHLTKLSQLQHFAISFLKVQFSDENSSSC